MARNFTSASTHYLEHAAAVSTTLPLTFAAWARQTAAGALQAILSIADSASGVRFALLSTGTHTIQATHSDGTTTGSATTTATGTINVWMHAAAVFNTNADRTVYLDGGNGVNNTTSVTGSMAACNVTQIGRRRAVTYWDGDIAEAGIWSVALDASEIAALGKGVSPLLIRPGSLLAYWPLIGRYSPEICPKGGFDMTVTSAVVAAHPRIYYGGRSPFSYTAPTATGLPRLVGPSFSLAGHGGLAA